VTNARQSFLSPENPDDFGQFRIIIRAEANGFVGLNINLNLSIDIATRSGADVITDAAIFGGNVNNAPGFVSGNNYRMIASPTSLVIFLVGTFASDGTVFVAAAPAIPVFQRGKKITGATNASPVVYTTSAAHGYTSGAGVTCRYINGNLGANATGSITVLSPTTFSVTGSVGTGAYTSGGIVWNGTLKEVGECVVCSGSASTGSVQTWRETTAQNRNSWIINGTALTGGTTGRPTLLNTTINSLAANTPNAWFNGNPFGVEPWVAVGTTIGGTPLLVGQLRNAALSQVSTPGDNVPAAFDGHTWINITNSYAGTSTVAAGALYWATS